MGLLETASNVCHALLAKLALWQVVLLAFSAFFTFAIILNVLSQVLFRDPSKPPVVWHLLPVLGSTITYGMDPFDFFFSCREKYGDVFTFILLGRKMTVCLGTKGNEFILNGKLKDANAEEIYNPLCGPGMKCS